MKRAEVIERLIEAAFDAMHHDADRDGKAALYEETTLRRKFGEILSGGTTQLGEPVAWRTPGIFGSGHSYVDNIDMIAKPKRKYYTPLYAAEVPRSAASTVEPVAYVPLSKSPNNPGEPVWRETFPAGWIEAGSERWQGYDLKALHFAAPTTSPEPDAVKEAAEALCLLAAYDERLQKLHDLLETIREQIRTGVKPEHRPKGLFQNIQDAVYNMRGRTLLMNDAAIVGPLVAITEGALSRPAHGGWEEALSKGFMTACSGDGEYQIKIGFENLKDMQEAHLALCRSAFARNHGQGGGPRS